MNSCFYLAIERLPLGTVAAIEFLPVIALAALAVRSRRNAAALALPIGILDAAPAFADPVVLAAAVGMGVSSSVIPYVSDQLAMARLSRATYALMVALMVALLPATATVIGVVVLTQVPSLRDPRGGAGGGRRGPAPAAHELTRRASTPGPVLAPSEPHGWSIRASWLPSSRRCVDLQYLARGC